MVGLQGSLKRGADPLEQVIGQKPADYAGRVKETSRRIAFAGAGALHLFSEWSGENEVAVVFGGEAFEDSRDGAELE